MKQLCFSSPPSLPQQIKWIMLNGMLCFLSLYLNFSHSQFISPSDSNLCAQGKSPKERDRERGREIKEKRREEERESGMREGIISDKKRGSFGSGIVHCIIWALHLHVLLICTYYVNFFYLELLFK